MIKIVEDGIESRVGGVFAGLLVAGIADALDELAEEHPNGLELRSIKLVVNDYFESGIYPFKEEAKQ